MRKPQDVPLVKALAAEVKARRLALELSQEELAHRAGLNRTFVGKIEVAVSQPSLTVFFALAEALQTEAVELLACIATRAKKERNTARSKASKS